jgi:hypothetical protein
MGQKFDPDSLQVMVAAGGLIVLADQPFLKRETIDPGQTPAELLTLVN